MMNKINHLCMLLILLGASESKAQTQAGGGSSGTGDGQVPALKWTQFQKMNAAYLQLLHHITKRWMEVENSPIEFKSLSQFYTQLTFQHWEFPRKKCGEKTPKTKQDFFNDSMIREFQSFFNLPGAQSFLIGTEKEKDALVVYQYFKDRCAK